MSEKPKSKASDSIQALAATILAVGIIASLVVGFLSENWYIGVGIIFVFAVIFFALYYWGKSVKTQEDNRDYLRAIYELLRTRLKE